MATGADATAYFNALNLQGPISVNLDTSYTIGNLFFDNQANAYPYTITGATLTLMTSGATAPAITVTSNLTANIAVQIFGTQGFTKQGAGTLSLSVSNGYTGNTVVNGGLLQLDFTQGTTTDILPEPTTLVFSNGGALSVLGTGAGISQTILGGLVLNPGAANITANISGGSTSTLSLGSITRNTGSVVNFIAPTSGNTFTTTTPNGTGSILGGWAIYTNNTSGATGFAAASGGNIIPLASYAAGGTVANYTISNNIDMTSSGAITPSASVTFNSLRFNNAGGTDYTLTLSGANTINSGGILVTAQVGPGANAIITGGTLTSGNGSDLILTQLNYYKPLTITSQVTGAVGVTTAGFGTTVLGGANNYTGATTVGGGTLLANTTSSLPGYNVPATSSSGVTVLGGGTLSVSTSNAGPWLPTDIDTLRANATFNSGSALGFDISVGNSLTYSSNISGALGITKNNDGTLILTGNNTYTGLTTINGGPNNSGVLSASSIANAGVASAIGAGTDLVFSLGGTFQYTGSTTSVNRGINLQFNGGVINVSTLGTNLSLSGLVYGPGGLTKSGPGTLTISGIGTYAGPTLVTAGTLVFSGANSIPTGNNLTIFSGATVTIGAGATPTLAGLSGGGTLNLLAATQLILGSDTGSGSFQGTISSSNPSALAIVKNGSGIQALLGNNTYGGGTTINSGTLLISPQTVGSNPLGTGPISIPTAGVTLAYRQILPVPTTGYNKDIIYGIGEGSNAPIRSTADLKVSQMFDTVNNWAYYSAGVPATAGITTYGLPKNLAINSLLGGGSTFIMQSYNANNALFLTAGATGTLGIGSPGSFKSINLLGASSNGSATTPVVNVTLNFQDGTSTVTSVIIPDWFNNSSAAIQQLDRYNPITNTFDNVGNSGSIVTNSNPRMYQIPITLSATDSAKVLTSLTFNNTGTGGTVTSVFAVNGTTSGAPSTVSPGNAVNITAAGTTNLEVSGYNTVNFGALTLNGTAGANIVSLTGTTGSFMTFTGTSFMATAPTFTVATGVTMNLGTLTDAGTGIGFTKNGAGTLVLASGTAYTGGPVAISAGTVIAQSPLALPGYVTSGQVTLASGAALVVGYGGTGNFTSANITTLQQNVSFASNTQFGIDVSSVSSATYNSVLTLGTGVGFLKTGVGTLVLGNANTYTGVTTISGGELSAGTLGLAGFASSIGSSSSAATNLVFNNGALLLYTGGTSTTNRSFTLNAGTGTASGGGFDIPSGTILTESGASTGSGIFYKSGAGTLVLTGTNTSTGGVTIGSITFVNGVPVVANGGGTLQVGAGSTIGTLPTGAVIDNGTLTYFRSDTVSLSNAISGTGNIIKMGVGSLTLTGTNTYTGTTTVSTGTLIAGSVSAFGTNSAISVASGATFALNGFSNTIGSLSGAGTVTDNSTTNATLTLGTDNTSQTFTGVIQNGSTGALSLVKNGTGTLTLTGSSTYSGGVSLNNGTITVNSDAALGTGSFTETAFATLNFAASTTTNKSFNLGGGNLTIGTGATLTVNGGQIGGGYIGGTGSLATNATNGAIFSSITTQPSTTFASNSSNDRFFNFSNGGAMTIASNLANPVIGSGFVNQGSGTVNVGANSTFNVTNFQSYGVLNVLPAPGSGFTIFANTGTASLYFNGGSRTFIGTPATAAAGTAGIDLGGQNAIIAGGLFVNNGVVYDSSLAGNATLVADYGARIKGAGTYQNAPITRNGGVLQSGNSPGSSNYGKMTVGGGNTDNLAFQINNATGVSGPTPDGNNNVSGWSLFNIVRQNPVASFPGDLTWSASTQQKLTLAMQTLSSTQVGQDVQGPMTNFNPSQSYSWKVFQYAHNFTDTVNTSPPSNASAYNALLTSETVIDTTNFVNSFSGGTFSLSLTQLGAGSGGELDIVYTPAAAAPEPSLLIGIASLALGAVLRRRK